MTANALSRSPGAAPNKSLDLIEPSIPNPPRGPTNHPSHRSIRSRKRLRVPVPSGVPAQPSRTLQAPPSVNISTLRFKKGGGPASRRFPTPSPLRVDISHLALKKVGGVPPHSPPDYLTHPTNPAPRPPHQLSRSPKKQGGVPRLAVFPPTSPHRVGIFQPRSQKSGRGCPPFPARPTHPVDPTNQFLSHNPKTRGGLLAAPFPRLAFHHPAASPPLSPRRSPSICGLRPFERGLPCREHGNSVPRRRV